MSLRKYGNLEGRSAVCSPFGFRCNRRITYQKHLADVKNSKVNAREEL